MVACSTPRTPPDGVSTLTKSSSENTSDKTAPRLAQREVARAVSAVRGQVEKRIRSSCPDEAAAEDVVSEAICRLYYHHAQHPEKFPSVAIIPCWLLTAARFIAREEARSLWRLNRIDAPSDEHLPEDGDLAWAQERAGLLAEVATPEEIAQAREAYAALIARYPEDLALLTASGETERTPALSNTERSQRRRARKRIYVFLETQGLASFASHKPRRLRSR